MLRQIHLPRHWKAILLVVLGWGVTLVVFDKLNPNDPDITYSGSSSCAECHQAEHQVWKESLHRKMMRAVSEQDAVIADFNDDDVPTSFRLDDVKWVIGSKWQQQFMGHDGHTETLLPGAWNVATSSWKTQSWDGWTEPQPLQRCHGCHTVGLDTESGEFVEPGIGCESCHGAGEWHVISEGTSDIHTGLEAEQCGQCHARGRSSDGSLFYPNTFRPGSDLEEVFTEWEPDYLQNSSAWWGNGRERKRHQEYTAWKVGGHANALKVLQEDYDGRFGPLDSDCLVCHSAEATLNTVTDPIQIAEAKNGVTCSVCHNVHGNLDELRIECDRCHTQGAYYHKNESFSDHIPCPPEANLQCVDCHMPKTVRNGGEFSLHSHFPGIIPPSDTAKFGVPSSCANGGCHKNDTPVKLMRKYKRFYQP